MIMTLTKVVQTCFACPSQWDAWTTTGQRLYLRYRWGIGTVNAYTDVDGNDLTTTVRVTTFNTGDSLDGTISLEDFMDAANLTLAPHAEVS